MAIQFELYKTPRPKGEEGKKTYHVRVVNFRHIDTDYLAKEIQIAASLTEGDMKSVLESLSHFIRGRLQEGQNVHLDDIGYFQTKLNSKGPITPPKQRANQIKLKANVSFKADAKSKRSVSVVHIERSKLRRHSASHSNDEIDKLLTSYFSNSPVLTRGDFQGLYSFTSTTASRRTRRLKEEEKKLKNIDIYYNPIYVSMPRYYGKARISTNQEYNIEKENQKERAFSCCKICSN